MAHAYPFVDWDDPESVPYFFRVFWPGLADEEQRNVHHQLRPILSRYAQPSAQGHAQTTIHQATSLPTVQSAEKVIPPYSPLGSVSRHASRLADSFTNKSLRPPYAKEFSDNPLDTADLGTCPRQAKRTKKAPTGHLPFSPAQTLSALHQLAALHHPTKRSLETPSIARALPNVLSPHTEPYIETLVSATDENLQTRAFQSAEAFFSRYARDLQLSGSVVSARNETEAAFLSAAIALRFHYLTDVILRDHLVWATRHMPVLQQLSKVQAKNKIIDAWCTVLSRPDKDKIDRQITDGLSRGAKYLFILQKLSISAVTRLNPDSNSYYYGHKVSDELLGNLERAGAKTRPRLLELAQDDPKNEEVELEITAACFLLLASYQYHLKLFPGGCGGQDCHWRGETAEPPHARETAYPNKTRSDNLTAELPSNIDNDNTASPKPLPDSTTAASSPANETSLRSFLSPSRKVSDLSNINTRTQSPNNVLDASFPRSRTSPNAIHLSPKPHDAAADDVYTSSVLLQPSAADEILPADLEEDGTWNDSDFYPLSEFLVDDGTWNDSDFNTLSEFLASRS